MKFYYVLWGADNMCRIGTALIGAPFTGEALIQHIIAEVKKLDPDGMVLGFSCAGENGASYEQMELEKVKAERDRYWGWIKNMGCETCSGDCAKCDGQSGWVWSGEVKEG